MFLILALGLPCLLGTPPPNSPPSLSATTTHRPGSEHLEMIPSPSGHRASLLMPAVPLGPHRESFPHRTQEHPAPLGFYWQGLVWHQEPSTLSQMWTDVEKSPLEQKRSQLGLEWKEFASGTGWGYDLGLKGGRAMRGQY